MTHAACPALLISAPSSGQGKTTVAAALARLHARCGARVRAFKCGPDFLDPRWLELASGAPVHPLDLWMTGEGDCARRLHQAAQEAQLLIVEGVMGLFDGEPSAADLAGRFGIPVLPVINGSAMAGTFGALALGLREYRSGLAWAGVLANRVAGERHAAMLQSSLRPADAWLGALPRRQELALPERHLGLVAVDEMDDAMQRLDAAADALAETPLGRMSLADLQRWSVRFDAPPAVAQAPVRPLAGRTVAVARDAAFCFIYAGNIDCLRELGAQVAYFSPLAGEPLPPCDALWVPGGYPELHAGALSNATRLRQALHDHVEQGKPVWAECGGMMALFEQLVTADGHHHAMWGLLPGKTTMASRLAGLGPQQLALEHGVLRGHTFHYSVCETVLEPQARTERPAGSGRNGGEAVYRRRALQASYFHAWFPSSPEAAAQLFLPQEEIA
ncbi:hydrogenobyrinic acid a,c-diamide synthase (glutamine-hydrolysing) /cobyrinate a,c-diamide synthase [Variovorax sp. HW608]|uniref:cobyrinate a,c-diamide synthase n=1 Tax=Variovorax sp. HW608 TaxID=1034889 RepID=UPI0008201613|nr:cobyrinate a,c-diamide synthase [Variovorax sp. HW608]SCK27233.1 hydrogenobyrinic acid a,c-diamide synthase (glutamine-hydrolysing) /cobyrinate a,c-diamide synthase [Variovorax sp. HW608]